MRLSLRSPLDMVSETQLRQAGGVDLAILAFGTQGLQLGASLCDMRQEREPLRITQMTAPTICRFEASRKQGLSTHDPHIPHRGVAPSTKAWWEQSRTSGPNARKVCVYAPTGRAMAKETPGLTRVRTPDFANTQGRYDPRLETQLVDDPLGEVIAHLHLCEHHPCSNLQPHVALYRFAP